MSRKLSNFEKKHSLEERKKASISLKQRYPDRIPVILCRGTTDLPLLEKTKYLVPRDTTMGKFVLEIRKTLSMSEIKALFLFVNDVLVPATSIMEQVYEKYKSDDGFLYISYNSENTFG